MAKHEEFLKQVKAKAENVTADCGDNSCRFAKDKTGMRTNGGCRCIEIRDPSLRHFTQMANPQAVLTLLATIEKLKSQRDLVLRAADVDELGYGSPSDYDKELDEIVGLG